MKKRIYVSLLVLALVVSSLSIVSWADESVNDAGVSIDWDEALYVPPAPSDNGIMTMAFDDAFTSLPIFNIYGCNIPYASYANSVTGLVGNLYLYYRVVPSPLNSHLGDSIRYVVAITGDIDGLYTMTERQDSDGTYYTRVEFKSVGNTRLRFSLLGTGITSTSSYVNCEYVAVDGDTTYFVLRPIVLNSVNSTDTTYVQIDYPKGSSYSFNIGYFNNGSPSTGITGSGGGGDIGGSGSGDIGGSGGSGTAT